MAKVSIIAKLTAAPGKRDELIAAFQPVMAAVEAEPGTELYLLHTDVADENVVWFYERYADQAAFDAHAGSAAMKSFGPSLAGLVGGRPELTILNFVGGKGA